MKKKQLLYESLCLYQQKRNVFYFVGVRRFWVYKVENSQTIFECLTLPWQPGVVQSLFEPSTNTAYIEIPLKVIVFILQLILLIVCALKDRLLTFNAFIVFI